MQKASSLALYSPGQGYHYLPQNYSQKDKAVHTPMQSREGSAAPEQSSHLPITSKKLSAKGGDFATLLDAYQQFNKYGNEYMDENPLLGEPGSFVFSNSREHVQARKEAEAKRAQQQAEMKKAQEDARTAAATMKAQLEASKTEIPAVKVSNAPTPTRKGSRAPDGEAASGRKIKRRKSKAPGTPAATAG